MANTNLEQIATQLVSTNQLITERFDEIQKAIDDGDVSGASGDELESVKKEMDALSKAFKKLKETRKRFKKLKKEYFEKARGMGD